MKREKQCLLYNKGRVRRSSVSAASKHLCIIMRNGGFRKKRNRYDQ